MPAVPRRELVDPDAIEVHHCYSRCVRRAFLCGKDPDTKTDYSYRKDWVEDLTQWLAAIFAIQVLGMGALDNHMHHVLRTRPDLARRWSEMEVARRWWLLSRVRRGWAAGEGLEEEPTEQDLEQLLSCPKLGEYRKRLSSLSWFMKELKELISKRANAEDDATGAFWEGRFKSTHLVDEQAVLACNIYVDLNMIRAGMARRLEESRYTTAYHRCLACRQRAAAKDGSSQHDQNDAEVVDSGAVATGSAGAIGRLIAGGIDRWLAPINSRNPETSTAPRWRCSDDGMFEMTAESYLHLLEWTAGSNRDVEVPVPNAGLKAAMERLGIDSERWFKLIDLMQGALPRMLGHASSLEEHARRLGKKWFKGVRACREAFSGGSRDRR